MESTSALVLFAHGARDVGWSLPLDRLRDAIAQLRPGVAIRTAFLELQPPGLPETLAELAAGGATRIDIAPIFWSQGGHITRDLPQMLAAFAERAPRVRVRVLPVLANLPGMDAFVARALVGQIDAPPP
jgi:sirohydrochlorin cobaltochelatase